MHHHHTKNMHLYIFLLALTFATTQAFSTHNNCKQNLISNRRVDKAYNIHKSTLKYRSINIHEDEDEYYCNDIHPRTHELQLQELDRIDSRLILARLQQADFNTPFTDQGLSASTSTESISNEEEDSSLVETVKAFLPVAVEIGAVVSLTSNHVQ